jgi:S-disulfanyl-L-cysteine oxidoreductase SoxD
MKFTLALFALILTPVVAVLHARATMAAQQDQAPASPAGSTTSDTTGQMKTQWDGIYTEEQAARGELIYTKSCASCHGAELGGTEKGLPLAGGSFDANWNGVKLGELSERMRTTMPVDSPGSLTRRQNADVLAYMLHKAKTPAGQTDVPTNVDQLNLIRYVARKPAAD